jgi:transcriptional regulator with XRE-family HTH domain
MPKKEYIGDGLTLYNIVQRKRWSQEKALKELGISRGTLYNYYESDTLTQKQREYLADKLSVPASEFGQLSNMQPLKEAEIDREFWGNHKIVNVHNPFNEFEMLAIMHNAFVLAALLMNKAHGEVEEFRVYRVSESFKDSEELYKHLRPPVKNTLNANI